ncbi:DUF7529 family protein [Natrialbaceae archaeon AArc-T1-2]|uniref:DUF7529 family protein n=1 Tax=Natrialbaceae archaeon AArc-T1-2 TaxID=3053904 RepID=UPI00255B111F|nr:hypothetical protein [Natrialbaceae archaeon AArc-T1-2]WIV68353.1 hypothetical protein QQ977_06430 [Natrialbaceae archaeon AArc-T1-2]
MTGADGTDGGTDVAPEPDDPWTELLADTEEIATEYREAGWEAVAVRPTDVTAVNREERAWLTVFATDAEYEPVASVVDRDEATFEGADVYRRQVKETTYVLAVELDAATETAVVVPLSYDLAEGRGVLESALEAGELTVRVRPPSIDDGWVSFAHDEPSLFVADDAFER